MQAGSRRLNSGLAGSSLRDIWNAIAQLKGQSESSRRRLAQVEHRVEVQLQDRLESKGDVRERLAEIQGTADALIEDVQCLRQRMDSVDQRRAADATKDLEKLTELAAQFQALDHQSRMNASTFEENQRRQVTRQCRIEQSLEDLSSKVAALRVKLDGQLQRTAGLAERLDVNEPLAALRAEWFSARSQDHQRWDAELSALRGHLEELGERLETSLSDINEAFQKNIAEIPQEQDADPWLVPAATSGYMEGAMDVALPPPGLSWPEEDPDSDSDSDSSESLPCIASASHELYMGFAQPGICMMQPGIMEDPGPEMAVVWQGTPGPPSEGKASRYSMSYPQEASPELHVVAGHLLAADALAARVVELERRHAESQEEADEAPGSPGSPSPMRAQLYKLSQEVSELQAQLLSTRLHHELKDGDPTDPLQTQGQANLAVVEGQLKDLEDIVQGLEESTPMEAEATYLPSDLNKAEAAEAVQTQEDREVLLGEEILAGLADRLEPLEHAFRLVAECFGQMQMSPKGIVTPLENGHNDQEPEQLFAKASKMQLSPVLEEQLRRLDEVIAASEENGKISIQAHDLEALKEEVAEVKLSASQNSQALESLQDDVNELRMVTSKVVAQVCEPATKVSPLAAARGKLDMLTAELSDLQSRMKK